MGFESAIQAAVFARLNAGAIGAPVYDAVPQTAAFPYVTIGEDNHSEWDTVTDYGSDASITVHTWSRYRGRKETKEIQGKIYDALHDVKLTLTGYNFVSVYFETSVSFMDADGLTRHGVQTFRILIERV